MEVDSTENEGAIPVYPLSVILKMDDTHLPIFVEFLNITDDTDIRGQIALNLNRLGKLSLTPPITTDNLATLIEISRFKIKEGTDPTYPKVDRYQRMLYYLNTEEFRASITSTDITSVITTSDVGGEVGTVFDSGPITVDRAITYDPTMTVDPTMEIEDRADYFEITEANLAVYMEANELYESAFQRSLSEASILPGQLYLLYGTIKPNLERRRKILETLSRDLDWMPDMKKNGWLNVLNRMIAHINQDPMKFVGLIMIQANQITQINSRTTLVGVDPESKAIVKLIKSNSADLVKAIRDDSVIEDEFGHVETNIGVWFEVPTLDDSTVTKETEIIGQARFKVMELTKVLVKSGRLRLPKLKIDTLYL